MSRGALFTECGPRWARSTISRATLIRFIGSVERRNIKQNTKLTMTMSTPSTNTTVSRVLTVLVEHMNEYYGHIEYRIVGTYTIILLSEYLKHLLKECFKQTFPLLQ